MEDERNHFGAFPVSSFKGIFGNDVKRNLCVNDVVCMYVGVCVCVCHT